MTTWRSFLSWKLRTPFLIIDKSLLWGDSPWWPTKGAKGAYITAKFLVQDEPPWWPPEGVSCPESWGLPSWSQSSIYSGVTHLDDHLKEFLVLKVEDSLLNHSQVSTLRWLTLMTTWRSFLSWKLKTPCWPTEKACLGNCMVNSLVETRRHWFWSVTFSACFVYFIMTILPKVSQRIHGTRANLLKRAEVEKKQGKKGISILYTAVFRIPIHPFVDPHRS